MDFFRVFEHYRSVQVFFPQHIKQLYKNCFICKSISQSDKFLDIFLQMDSKCVDIFKTFDTHCQVALQKQHTSLCSYSENSRVFSKTLASILTLTLFPKIHVQNGTKWCLILTSICLALKYLLNACRFSYNPGVQQGI